MFYNRSSHFKLFQNRLHVVLCFKLKSNWQLIQYCLNCMNHLILYFWHHPTHWNHDIWAVYNTSYSIRFYPIQNRHQNLCIRKQNIMTFYIPNQPLQSIHFCLTGNALVVELERQEIINFHCQYKMFCQKSIQ